MALRGALPRAKGCRGRGASQTQPLSSGPQSGGNKGGREADISPNAQDTEETRTENVNKSLEAGWRKERAWRPGVHEKHREGVRAALPAVPATRRCHRRVGQLMSPCLHSRASTTPVQLQGVCASRRVTLLTQSIRSSMCPPAPCGITPTTHSNPRAGGLPTNEQGRGVAARTCLPQAAPAGSHVSLELGGHPI